MLRGGRLLVARRPTPLLISFFYIKTLHAFVRAVGHPPPPPRPSFPTPREKLISYLVACVCAMVCMWDGRAELKPVISSLIKGIGCPTVAVRGYG